jgi:L-asparagine transporter-like permease
VFLLSENNQNNKNQNGFFDFVAEILLLIPIVGWIVLAVAAMIGIYKMKPAQRKKLKYSLMLGLPVLFILLLIIAFQLGIISVKN